MNNETKERIRYFRNYLPKMREKIIAAAVMLVIACIMVTSATFAWMTLSARPEVTSIDTTVTSNGNLEIALCKPDGSVPGKSAVGDSSARPGQNVIDANLTWGNLVNLTDPSYGLSKITLRPAALNGTSGLLTNPLYGVSYGEDGRVGEMTTEDDFAYVYYDNQKDHFMADLDSTHYGVRAISTVLYQNLGAGSVISEFSGNVTRALNTSKNNYGAMVNEKAEPGKSYISSLEGLIQIYAQNMMDRKPQNQLDITKYVPALYDMMSYFNDSVMSYCGESYLQLAHMSRFIHDGEVNSGYTVDTLCSDSLANKLPDYIQIDSLKQYAQDRRTLASYMLKGSAEDFSDLTANQKKSSLAYWAYLANNGTKVYWTDISAIINWIVDINTCAVDGYNINSLMSHITEVAGKKDHYAEFNSGALFRTEKRIGQRMNPTINITLDFSNMPFPASLAGVQNLAASVTTTATEPYEIVTDRDTIRAKGSGGPIKGTDATAEDTYAMALDLWLRTNAGSRDSQSVTTVDGNVTTVVSPEVSFLTLEGNIRTRTEYTDAYIKDINGNDQLAYTVTITIEGQQISEDCYQRNGEYFYIDDSGKEVNISKLAAENNITPTYAQKKEAKTVVIGYDGENRVWDDDQMAAFDGEGTSTTQGNGSCYVFYADTPTDQARFLELLSAMKVVFVDSTGHQIGLATMDTQNYYAQNGRVTVPLVLDKGTCTYLYTDMNGKEIYGLTTLQRGVATRITALVYLDGTKLSNDMVLASGDIQGTLNIQFSDSSVTKTVITTETEDGQKITDTKYTKGTDSLAIKQETLMDDYISVNASVSNSEFDFKPDNKPTTTLSVKIDGIDPKSVSAQFIRAINSTQGAIQNSFNLNGSGTDWNANYTFDHPGTYVLRSVWIDGNEYALTSPITVNVAGNTVTSLVCSAITEGRSADIMTADSAFGSDITLGFATGNATPDSVNGIFMDDSGRQVTVVLSKNDDATMWSGKANFTSSGTYTMQYYEVDGKIYELNEALRPTLNILLGLKVRTWISCSPETLAELQAVNANATANSFTLNTGNSVTLNIEAEVYDNNGNRINALSDVKLVYGKVGSALKKLDSDMVWDSSAGRYIGSFLVSEAGTYKFTSMTVGSNTITSYTNAPNIQAMPPNDAYYNDNRTDEYQYAPNKDAVMTLGIAYSGAATGVTARMSNGISTETVPGVMGSEAPDTGNVPVNLWEFKIPSVNDSQEGEWKILDITMYGVYYNGNYYDDENGAIVDLKDQNVRTKVVNDIHVTFNGISREFDGKFMDLHSVTDMTVRISDYEGLPIKGLTISDVKVAYYLDSSSISLDSGSYNYSADGLDTQVVDAIGSLSGTSEIDYNISSLDFRYAGEYNKCTISFHANGKTYNAGGEGTKVVYNDNGKPSNTFPKYIIRWERPSVTITGTTPAMNELFTTNAGSRQAANEKLYEGYHNYWEPLYARVGAKHKGTMSYDWPQITLKLDNAGQNYSKATVLLLNASDHKYDQTYEFTTSKLSDTKTFGTGGTFSLAHMRPGNQKISTISMTYGSTVFTLKIDELSINYTDTKIPTMSYDVSEYADSGVTSPEAERELPHNTNEVILPQLVEDITMDVKEAGEQGTPETQTSESIVYYSESKTSGCSTTTTYYPFKRTVTTVKTPSAQDIYRINYKFKGWKIKSISYANNAESFVGGGKVYTPGSKVNLSGYSNARYVAVPVYEEVSRDFISSTNAIYVEQTTTDTAQASSTSKPSGTKVDSSDILKAPKVETWWE